MSVRFFSILIILAMATPQMVLGNDIDCGLFNEIEITDPVGDATPGSSPSIDVVSVHFRQVADLVQFEMRTNGSSFDSMDLDCLLFFDTDRNADTGRREEGLGAEVILWVWTLGSNAVISRYDEDGTYLGDETGPRTSFFENGYTFNIPLEDLSPGGFHFNFDLSGGDPSGRDEGSIQDIVLEPAQQDRVLTIESDHLASSGNPILVNIPESGGTASIRVFLGRGSTRSEVTPPDVEFTVFHEFPTITDPEALISIDENGLAHYNSEGYVFVTARVSECSVKTEPFIIATGDVYGDPATDQVIAVWPTDYQPIGFDLTYGEIMNQNPRYLEMMNVAYKMESELYRGFRPSDGSTQVMAVLEVDSWCHASNPFLSPPGCYFSGNGSPMYSTMMHEMGHNFQDTHAMGQLLSSQGGKIAGAGFAECVGSLPVIYLASEMQQNGDDYGFDEGTFERTYFDEFVEADRSEWTTFDEFEEQIDNGEITGIFDESGDFDGVSMFCCFFQSHMYQYGGYSTPYSHELIRRFLNIFGDEEIPDFQADKVETYFVAAFSAAAGKDLREEFRFWGFEIDDLFCDQIMPMIESRIELFSDRFEYGNFKRWTAVWP